MTALIVMPSSMGVSMGTGLPSMRKRNASGREPAARTASSMVTPGSTLCSLPDMVRMALMRGTTVSFYKSVGDTPDMVSAARPHTAGFRRSLF